MPLMRPNRLAFPLALAMAAGLALSACTPRHVDLPKVIEVTNVGTGYFDAGIVEGNKNKLVPTITLQLKNVGTEPIDSVQLIAKFNRIGETEEWGSAPYVQAIGTTALAAGQTTKPLVLRCDRGYTGEQSREDMLHHSQFVDVRVELFGKYRAQSWVKMGEYKIARDLLTQ